MKAREITPDEWEQIKSAVANVKEAVAPHIAAFNRDNPEVFVTLEVSDYPPRLYLKVKHVATDQRRKNTMRYGRFFYTHPTDKEQAKATPITTKIAELLPSTFRMLRPGRRYGETTYRIIPIFEKVLDAEG